MPTKLIIPEVKRRYVARFQTLFGVDMSIFEGVMAPGGEVNLTGTSVFILSSTIQLKKISISVIALFDNKGRQNPKMTKVELGRKR